MPVPAIQFNHFTKRYGNDRGVNDLHLKIPQGEIFGFLGPNGAGKTTTIRSMLDFIRPSSGSIKVLGLDSVSDALSIRKRVGYLSGDMEMDRRLTGRQYLEYVAHLRGNVPWANIQKLIEQLDCQTNKKIAYLSRGNKQKIGLVAALMHNPDVLILDEPTSGLDPLIQQQFQKLIADHKARGKTAFISSHVLSEVQQICDHVGFIRDGKLMDVQPLNSLRRKAFRNVTISLSRKNAQLIKKLQNLKGLHGVEADGTTITTKITDNFHGFIGALTEAPIKDLVIEEASLEDLFMHYYQEEPTVTEATHAK